MRHSTRFKEQLRALPVEIRKKFYKQANYLMHNLMHPSLRAKKYSETKDIWQARIDKKHRFYFTIEDDTYVLINIKHHSD